MGSRIRYQSRLSNRDSIGRDLITFAHESRYIARSVIELDIGGRQVMSDILDGYEQIVKMLEFHREHSDSSDAEGIAMAVFRARTSLLDDVDVWLAPLEDEARGALRQADDALATAARAIDEISEAQGEATTEWDNFRIASPKWDVFVPWITVSHIEKKHLRADLEMTDASLSALSEARVNLNHLANDLTAYRRSVQVARDGNLLRFGNWSLNKEEVNFCY